MTGEDGQGRLMKSMRHELPFEGRAGLGSAEGRVSHGRGPAGTEVLRYTCIRPVSRRVLQGECCSFTGQGIC